MEPDAGRRRELATFLRAQRARLTPADVGLPQRPGQRRTPGLRREELAGIGLSWYTWLEQGRAIPASARVIDALARGELAALMTRLPLDQAAVAVLRERYDIHQLTSIVPPRFGP